MSAAETKAILVVSFGTSFADTRKLTIEAIENKIAGTFPEYHMYRAWTSKMIIKKVKRTEDLSIDTVPEAMARMAADGITDVIVQPTHVANGYENDVMKEDVLKYKDQFQSIRFGNPLLTLDEDMEKVAKIIHSAFCPKDDRTALVLMGHGTAHDANTVYAAMDYRFRDLGYPYVSVGTVEAYPSVDTVLRKLKEQDMEKVVLSPFMIVAGDHARNDMAGDGEDSWKNIFKRAGYEVSCVVKGLGEYEAIQDIFVDHIRQIL